MFKADSCQSPQQKGTYVLMAAVMDRPMQPTKIRQRNDGQDVIIGVVGSQFVQGPPLSLHLAALLSRVWIRQPSPEPCSLRHLIVLGATISRENTQLDTRMK
jgi:hypothetical protein